MLLAIAPKLPDLTTTYSPTTGLAPNATITGTFTFPSTSSNGFTLFYCGTIGGVDNNGYSH